jgi:chromosome segregation ATPase
MQYLHGDPKGIIRESPMARVWNTIPRLAIFLAGVVAGVITTGRKAQTSPETASGLADLKQSLSDLESRLAKHEFANAGRMAQIESRMNEHDAKLADVPSTSQIVAAMEQLLCKTMANLDERLTAQAHSIEVLKTTVSQTDGLLERVLESLDSLQASETSEMPGPALVQKPL